ncbi:zinc knuckle protein [Gregarina niphandrodes]|uniref:Zinc knuckle protein n=1 Tax=Gregarina niphandrodes TaxID=110365 RepID=A0A023B6B2_GRENI|nr:zinc knuckle protein [Gregarina niphandrodes]EZG65912.1 zinc knuckle protein [Gregarina niphandrodes]|eukprot:XP_011134024.1 zinc knuckle protein [Gregarina niphandrodes]
MWILPVFRSYNCGRLGHKASTCQLVLRCRRCGKPGHKERECEEETMGYTRSKSTCDVRPSLKTALSRKSSTSVSEAAAGKARRRTVEAGVRWAEEFVGQPSADGGLLSGPLSLLQDFSDKWEEDDPCGWPVECKSPTDFRSATEFRSSANEFRPLADYDAELGGCEYKASSEYKASNEYKTSSEYKTGSEYKSASECRTTLSEGKSGSECKATSECAYKGAEMLASDAEGLTSDAEGRVSDAEAAALASDSYPLSAGTLGRASRISTGRMSAGVRSSGTRSSPVMRASSAIMYGATASMDLTDGEFEPFHTFNGSSGAYYSLERSSYIPDGGRGRFVRDEDRIGSYYGYVPERKQSHASGTLVIAKGVNRDECMNNSVVADEPAAERNESYKYYQATLCVQGIAMWIANPVLLQQDRAAFFDN